MPKILIIRISFLIILNYLNNNPLVFAQNNEQNLTTEVLVISGSTSGISAGIQSARMKVSTLIVEESPWLGGMLTSAGVSATDGNHLLPSGIWNEFRGKLRAHYGGEAALATGWVSNTQFEPHIGDRIFKEMAAKEKYLSVMYGYHLIGILKNGNTVNGAIFENTEKKILKVNAKVVIDASDLGDGLAMAGAKYDLGMESRFNSGEAMASEKSNNIVQDMTWAAVLKDFGPKADKTIKKPLNYTPEIYKGSCAMTVDSIKIDCQKMLSYGKLPNEKYMINWPRFGNDLYLNVVEMDWSARKEALIKAKERTLGFIYYIQTELGYKNLGLAEDEFNTEDKLPYIVYHREGRRLKGIERFNINHVSNIYDDKPLYRTGISVGDYPVDHHHDQNPDAPKIAFPPIPPFSIPLGALIPESIDGLIVSDKAISVSNIINGATRLQPSVLLTGQAAGVLAALTVQNKQKVREVNIRKVQQALLDANAYLVPLNDINPQDKDFQAIQRVLTSGILKYKGEPYKWANKSWFYPDSCISIREFTQGLQTFDSNFEFIDENTNLTIEITEKILSQFLKKDISKDLKMIIIDQNIQTKDSNAYLSKRELSVIVDRLIKPFETKMIGFDGYFKPKKSK